MLSLLNRTTGRILFFLSYYITGEVRLDILNYIGNAGVLFIVLVFAVAIKKNNLPFIFILPLAFLFFSAAGWEYLFWTMASIQNHYVIFFGILGLYLISLNKDLYFFIGTLFCVISSFTGGNGLFVFIPAFVLLFQNKSNNKYKIVLGIIFLLVLFKYFNGYVKPSHHPSIFDNFLVNLPLIIKYFSNLSGVVVHQSLQMSIAKPVTFFSILLIIYSLFIAKTFNKFSFFYAVLFFSLLTNISATLGRYGFGEQQALDTRYCIYSEFYLGTVILIYLSSISNLKFKFFSYFLILSLVIFNQ